MTQVRVMLFSDFHNTVHYDDLKQALFNQPVPDVIFTLGDISVSDLLFIKSLFQDVPIYGVCGNHDSQQTLNMADILNIHGKVVEIGGVRFAGIGGSVRYKPGAYTMFSHNESMDLAKTLPPADILVSHDKAYERNLTTFSSEITKNPHEGMAGVSYYLRKHSPFLHIHGHIHTNKQYDFEQINTISVYGVAATTIVNHNLIDYRVLLDI